MPSCAVSPEVNDNGYEIRYSRATAVTIKNEPIHEMLSIFSLYILTFFRWMVGWRGGEGSNNERLDGEGMAKWSWLTLRFN